MGIKDTMRGGSGGTHAATGRQDFPHPDYRTRAANYSKATANHKNFTRKHFPLSMEQISEGNREAERRGIPVPPPGSWPTQGDVNTYQAVKEQLEN